MARIPMRECRLAFTDTETTSLDASVGEIIQIALIVTDLNGNMFVSDEGVAREYVWNMHPRWPERAEAEALSVNGYTREKWDDPKHGPVVTHQQAMSEYVELTKKCILVGAGIAYDWSMIEAELKRQSLRWEGHYHKIDTASLAWPLFLRTPSIESVSLKPMCDHYGISSEGAHDALVDIQRTREVYMRLIQEGAP